MGSFEKAMTADLITRLKAMQDTGRRTLGGGNVGVGLNGKTTISSSYGNEPILALRNPDGPEAAEKLEALEADNAKLHKACEEWYAENELLREALVRIASEHINAEGFSTGHIYHADCDACHRQKIAQAALDTRP